MPYALPAGVHGQAWVIKSRFSLFPDTGRAKGHSYRGAYFPADKHYNDSSVLVFVPDYMDNTKTCDFVHWFHGWYNNIDSSVRTFKLLDQYYAARRNAVFLFPEGPVNAPDSYAGKWESPNYFLPFTAEWWETLRLQTPQLTTLKRGKQVFAGHSGAYRVIAKNLQWADEVLLFDGLYGEIDSYLDYCRKPGKRFVHIYTNDGDTWQTSQDFMQKLDSLGIGYLHKEEAEIEEDELRANRIVLLHSQRGHNDIITDNNNLYRLLRFW